MEHTDNLCPVLDCSVEDHIPAIGQAAQPRDELIPGAAGERVYRQKRTTLFEQSDELRSGNRIVMSNKLADFDQIAFGALAE